MNKKLKNITGFSVIFAVGFSVILFCCLTEIAQADIPEASSCHHEDSDQQTAQDTRNTDECECEKDESFVFNEPVKIFPLSSSSPAYLTVSFLKQDDFLKKDYVFYNYHQVFPESPPLYLKNSVLRI